MDYKKMIGSKTAKMVRSLFESPGVKLNTVLVSE